MELKMDLPLRKYIKIRWKIEPLLALIIILLSIPLLLIIALLVWCSGPGPIFYLQKRSGYEGRDFYIVKFRSMIKDAEKNGPTWAQGPSDQRVTRIGRILRNTHLDELPQLWNVLRGELSFIGPRPERPEMIAKIVETLPEFRLRTQIKPGVTGLAQVSLGYAGSLLEARDKLMSDLDYCKNYSPLLDAKILLKTLRILFSGFKVHSLFRFQNELKLIVTLLLSFLLFSRFAHATSLATSLPIEDISKKLAELKTSTQDIRYHAIHNLRDQYKNETQLEILTNLQDFSKAAKKLYTDLKEEDWVIREADTLIQETAVRICQYTAFDLERYITNFNLMPSEAFRFQTIAFWKKAMPTLEDQATLSGFMALGSKVFEIVRSLGDPDYTLREAQMMIELAGIGLARVNPFFEGLFEITQTRAINSLNPNKNLFPRFNRLVVIGTKTSLGVIASFIDSIFGEPEYYYSNVSVQNGGELLTGKISSENSSHLSAFELHFDPHSGGLTGKINDPNLNQVEFIGKRISSSVDYYPKVPTPLSTPLPQSPAPSPSPPTLELNSFEGSYTGQIGSLPGTLKIQLISQDFYSAIFESKSQLFSMPTTRINFQGIDFMNKKAIMRLTSVIPSQSFQRIQALFELILIRDNATSTWNGISISSGNGKVNQAEFKLAKD